MRAIEFFAGIGGVSAACPWLDIAAAIDINSDSRDVYRANFDAPYWVREIESLSAESIRDLEASLWWMSPPCTPFTRRGNRLDLEDPRTKPLLHLVRLAETVRPETIVVENVVGFEVSKTFEWMQDKWCRAGYHLRTMIACPSEMNWPNRRRRVYVIATLADPPKIEWPPSAHLSTASEGSFLRGRDFIDASLSPATAKELWLEREIAQRYALAIDRFDPDVATAITACFTSSYGKVITRAGSYLQQDGGWRRFAPREVAAFLGFPRDFRLPSHLSHRRLWQLLGNSLSLPVVSRLMRFTQSQPGSTEQVR